MIDSPKKLLSVNDLRTHFRTDDGVVKAVDGVNFDIEASQTFAIVGESGCGKSVTAFSIMRLLQTPPALMPTGTIEFEGVDLLKLPEKQMRSIRGRQIGMIFQEPMSSLNPVFTCGDQISEAICLHRNVSGSTARDVACDLLVKVGIPEPQRRLDEYPHQLSGGMRQRIMIAMALSCDPKLLIADEPTTALDVTIQAQILELMRDIQQKHNLGILLITHDLAVVAQTAHRVAVMYASKIVETANVKTLFANPLHPYTHGLFRSLPRMGEKKRRLETIPGNVPNPLHFPTGCKFHNRCPIGCKLERCRTSEPPLKEIAPGHLCACWEAKGYDKAK